MADFFDSLEEKHIEMIGKQPVFFTSTAAANGRINLSPKGYDSFRILSPSLVGYLDLGGSGNETHAHLAAEQEDAGRITIMFCNFESPALILRIYGKGRAILPQDDDWGEIAPHFTLMPGTRQIFLINVESVQTSCGWGVPFMALEKERPTLAKYHAGRTADQQMEEAEQLTQSIDGLPVRVQARLPFEDQK